MEKENEKIIYQDGDPAELPESAFRELAADEHYRPVMHPAHDYAEVTPYSVILGLVLAVIFSAAAAYLGLRVARCSRPRYRSPLLLWVCRGH